MRTSQHVQRSPLPLVGRARVGCAPGRAGTWPHSLVALVLSLLACLATTPSLAGGGPAIPVGTGEILGARIGSGEEQALAILKQSLYGPSEDTGRIEGCPLDSIDVRWVTWGGLIVQFEEQEDGTLSLARWTYRLDPETGRSIPGGPAPHQIKLPGGVNMGTRFSDAARIYGFEPMVNDVFGVAMHFAETFAIMTREASIDAPIMEVGTPGIGFCE